MYSFFMSGTLVSLASVVRGQVGIQFRATPRNVDFWEDLVAYLCLADRYLGTDRRDGFVTIVASFDSMEEAKAFLGNYFRMESLGRDELQLVRVA